MERRFTHPSTSVRLDSQGDGPARIVGYAAVYYREGDAGTEYPLWTGVRERIQRGAFDRALREQQDVRALFNHDPNLVLGRTKSGTLRLFSDDVGLGYEITVPDTQAGRDVSTSVGRGDVTGSSFAFNVPKGGENWTRSEDGEIRDLVDLNVFDVSPTVFPAYTGTAAGVRADSDAAEARASFDRWQESQRGAGMATVAEARKRIVELDLTATMDRG